MTCRSVPITLLLLSAMSCKGPVVEAEHAATEADPMQTTGEQTSSPPMPPPSGGSSADGESTTGPAGTGTESGGLMQTSTGDDIDETVGETDAEGEVTGTTGESTETGRDESICAPSPRDQECDTCMKTECCTVLNDCYDHEGCACLVPCLDEGGTMPQCLQSCGLNGPPMAHQLVQQCAFIQCSMECPP